ncbi:MAG: hypothetical protein N2170_05595 [Bacteroidia bacterium]|nr:hypothetical protein [Bacteroidia bacterium]
MVCLRYVVMGLLFLGPMYAATTSFVAGAHPSSVVEKTESGQRKSLWTRIKEKAQNAWTAFQKRLREAADDLVRVLIIALIVAVIVSIVVWLLPWPLDVLIMTIALVVLLIFLLRYLS